MTRFLAIITLILALANSAPGAFFALQERDSTEVVQRGETTGSFDQLILAPNTAYKLWLFDPVNNESGSVEFESGDSGSTADIPPIFLGSAIGPDFDGDNLDADTEFILGTNPANSDTDGDGIRDGAEVRQGTNPLDSLVARTGIVGSTDTEGQALDVDAFNDLVAVADSTSGLKLFNVFNGMNPIVIGQVDTPGTGEAVAIGNRFSLIADGSQGVAVISISEPTNAAIVRQITLGSEVRCVAVTGSVGAAGTSAGLIALIDLASATVLDTIRPVTTEIADLTFGINRLYAVTEGELITLSTNQGQLSDLGLTGAAGGSPIRGRRRLSLGTNLLYLSVNGGYSIFSLTNPDAPVLLQQEDLNQFGFRQLALNGSGLGLAASHFNSTDPRDIDLYDLGRTGLEREFITTFQTPGNANAVEIYNGLAYVADAETGLQVINYLSFDSLGLPPSIQVDVTPSIVAVEEGAPISISARVFDDVQVRNVEFYIDGEKLATDGNFPFQITTNAPLLSQQASFVLQARVSDTGGNAAWSPEIEIAITPDSTAPEIAEISPMSGSLVGSISSVRVAFNEPMNRESLVSGGMKLVATGPDGLFGTEDDVLIDGTVTYDDEPQTGFIAFDSPLNAGLYRLSVGSPATDAAGNPLAIQVSSTFRVFSLADRDGDGVPDDWEARLGLSPDLADTDGNNINDGNEDFDFDQAPNAGEILILLTDPTITDTDGNGTIDGLEDQDGDFLKDGAELFAGADPFDTDTDDDGFWDQAEVAETSDPADPLSRPLGLLTGSPMNVLHLNGASIQAQPSINVLHLSGLKTGILSHPRVILQSGSQIHATPQVNVEHQ